ncbi:TadA family conjugal transfer-associated ATPase [Actinomyces minihominis]|uniref:TadA family conjugal transfer-associated ATPase n=1 Tax=Actinomyces minihominis TaxID=2002838 RepID=UPI0013ED4C5F|nr:TadA family conjugal transfer-associated ATPase [Actinomyces minihominis]
MGRLATARARRSVAGGRTPAEAVADESEASAGARAKVAQWHTMQASKCGMTLALWQLVRDPDVTDVVISGTRAWVDTGGGFEPVDLGLESEAEVRILATHMAAAAMRRLDDAQPIVDAVLPGPIRLHAVIPPLAQSGTSISLRVLRPRPFTLRDLEERKALDPDLIKLLEEAVNRRQSILLAGATGVGKTTLLATLLGLVDPAERVVVIEEVTELAIDHPHVVSLQARAQNIEKEGGVGLDELVRAAMRMAPDRLVLGECRGPEVREVLTALNTGHRGGMATIHANSIEDVPARLIALGLLAKMDRTAVATMAAAAFDSVVFLERDRTGRRFVSSLGQLRLRGSELIGETLWTAPGQTETRGS